MAKSEKTTKPNVIGHLLAEGHPLNDLNAAKRLNRLNGLNDLNFLNHVTGILGFGSLAKVLEPPYLVKEITDDLGKSLESCGKL